MTLTVELQGALIPNKACLKLVATNNTQRPVEVRGAGLKMPDGGHLALTKAQLLNTIRSHDTPAQLQPGEEFYLVVPLSELRERLEEEGIPIPATVQAQFHNKSGVYLSQPPLAIDFSS